MLVAERELHERADSKYVLTPGEAAALVGALADGYAVLRAGEGPVARYRTLYYDTPELDSFHAHRRGYRVRHKVRVRHYADRQVSYLEVKTRRNDLHTAKFRRERAYGDEMLDADDQAFVTSQTGIARAVQPQAGTRFRRITLLGLRDNERITVDVELVIEGMRRQRSLAGIAVVEVKQWPRARRTPIMLALRAAGRRPGWMSKYCAAIAFTHPGVRSNALLPGLRNLERGAA